jgi:hypothetical protein
MPCTVDGGIQVDGRTEPEGTYASDVWEREEGSDDRQLTHEVEDDGEEVSTLSPDTHEERCVHASVGTSSH